jgi:hypothetical protein
VGTIKFDWDIVSNVLEVEDAEDWFDDEAEIMDVCELEYCEVCEWIMSRNDCGDHPTLDFVCTSCEVRDNDE